MHFFTNFLGWGRRHWLTMLQIALSFIFLSRIFGDAALREEIQRLLWVADGRWLGVGLLSALITELLCAVRWWLMLRVFKVPVSMTRTCVFTLAGLFYSFILPGAGGGDIFRILYVIRLHPGKKIQVVASVIADRLCGMVALVIALGITLIRSDTLPLDVSSRSILKVSTFILSGPVIVIFLWWLTTFPMIRQIGAHRMPPKLRARLLAVGDGFWEILEHPREILLAIAVSCIAFAVHFATYFFSARAFELPVSLSGIFAIMPIVDALIMLPITFYGVGLRETLLQHLMGSLFGVSGAAATIASLTGFGLQAAVALVGGLLLPFTLPRRVEKAEESLSQTKSQAIVEMP